MEDRIKKIRSLFNTHGFGLEIGPSFNPVLPKRDGYNIEILDHLNQIQLKKKYRNAPNVNLDQIESVDYISDGGSIFEPIGKAGRYDFIIASHVIEHTVDFIRFLNESDRLLKPEGLLVLAVPDKRYTFDSIRSLSTTGQIIQSYLEKRKTHTPGQIFDEFAYNITRGGDIAWPPNTRQKLKFFVPLLNASKFLKVHKRSKKFIDIHSWQFSPSSFRLIIRDLNEVGLIKLNENNFVDTVGHEFFITLGKKRSKKIPSRERLAELILSENSIF